MKKIDVIKLKEEIKSLAGQLKFLNKRRKDRRLNLVGGYPSFEESKKIISELMSVLSRRKEATIRLTKLCTLRALMRDRIHFSLYTDLHNWQVEFDPNLKGISKDDLINWTEDVRNEFKLN